MTNNSLKSIKKANLFTKLFSNFNKNEKASSKKNNDLKKERI